VKDSTINGLVERPLPYGFSTIEGDHTPADQKQVGFPSPNSGRRKASLTTSTKVEDRCICFADLDLHLQMFARLKDDIGSTTLA
jgi:hypothetical protein